MAGIRCAWARYCSEGVPTASDSGGSVNLLSGRRAETALMLAYPQAMRLRVGGLLVSVNGMTTRLFRCLIKPLRTFAAGPHEYRTKSADSAARWVYRKTSACQDTECPPRAQQRHRDLLETRESPHPDSRPISDTPVMLRHPPIASGRKESGGSVRHRGFNGPVLWCVKQEGPAK